MMVVMKRSMISMGVAAILASPAYATNGMNMEGFGAKSAAMGGTSMAYDIGNSGMMGNPATLGLRKQGNNFGLGVTLLQPDVSASIPAYGMNSDSDGTSYVMPSISFIRKDGDFTYGVGVFAQGGMGTDYPGSSFLSGGTGLPQMSQVGFGRLMFPLAYQVNKELSIAAQVDYVWASMDLQMLQMDPMGNGGYVNVKDDSDFTGQMTGGGFAFNLGAVYQFNDEFSLGAVYRSESNIGDLEGGGTLTPFMGGMTPGAMAANYSVVDFQWPASFGIGMAWNVTPEFMVAADIKQLMWSQTMADFTLSTEIPAFGMTQTQSMPQNWDDQTVFSIGAQYKIDPAIALRIGYNYGANPVPDNTLNPLFPAIVESHYTFGAGWQIDKANSLAIAFTYAPSVTQTMTNPMAPPIEMSHGQTLWRLNYAYSF
ncbi:MAG: outer membrane protein transport protein [Halothiobacillaceae bacterium]|nr:outer membrane protein transport protein [Halothiobacillaceae bacterium]